MPLPSGKPGWGTIISYHCYPQATVYVYVHYSRSTCYPQAKEYEHHFLMYVLWVWEILDNCRVCRWRGFPHTEGRTAAESVSVHPDKMQPPRTACSATLHALVHTCTQTGWSLYTVSVNKKIPLLNIIHYLTCSNIQPSKTLYMYCISGYLRVMFFPRIPP